MLRIDIIFYEYLRGRSSIRPMLQRLTFSIGFLAATATVASAAETVVHDTTTSVEIKLDSTTVLCSSADYGQLFLKIGIPQLANITLLDHQNIGAGAPCVAAGVCQPGHMPADIIDPAHPTELVDIDVKAVREDDVDEAAHTCSTVLIERVKVNVRGFEFTHERTAELGSRPYEDCVTSTATGSGSGSAANAGSNGSGGKADGDGSTTAAPNGGCSVDGAGTGSLALVVLGAALGLRRRRR
jgi:MYXO-CTERM domain-containing protein